MMVRSLARPGSDDWFDRASAVIPGGVSSPVRAFRGVGGTPIVIRSAAGATVTDVDGHEYLDFVGSWGPLILGHAHPAVVEAMNAASRLGTSYGAPCQAEIELAEEVVRVYPGAEQVRFVSSGTEAVMSAVRLARGATGRDVVVKFAGCYHGHVDHLLVAAGSGLATCGRASSLGVPADVVANTRVAPLDDALAVERLFSEEGRRIAAVVIEPVGGGLPVGAFAGPRDLMRHLAPEGGVYQAGTLSGNPVAMTAGLTTLRWLQREDGWTRLDELGAHLETVVAQVLADSPLRGTVCRLGSLFWVAWLATSQPRSADALHPSSAAAYRSVFHGLLARRIALAPSVFEVGFLSLAHTRADIDRLADCLHAVLASKAEATS
jgi:glutamate-1-semialdehyde aminotransferase